MVRKRESMDGECVGDGCRLCGEGGGGGVVMEKSIWILLGMAASKSPSNHFSYFTFYHIQHLSAGRVRPPLPPIIP